MDGETAAWGGSERAAGAAPSGAAHSPQNLSVASTGAPQAGQESIRAWPHALQNLLPPGLSAPQFEHGKRVSSQEVEEAYRGARGCSTVAFAGRSGSGGEARMRPRPVDGSGGRDPVPSAVGARLQMSDRQSEHGPRVTPLEFLQAICDELHLPVSEAQRTSVKALVDVLNAHLLEAHGLGRRVVIVVDEAQQLAIDVLEQVRLLTNLETATQKLLQIILVGQPELRELVARPELRQLAQRITGRYHLDPLPRDETAAYVRHRLRVAGATNEIYTAGALREAHRLSHGIPRIINVIADRALLGAYTKDVHRVTGSLARPTRSIPPARCARRTACRTAFLASST